MDDEWLSTQEAADRLGITRVTLYKLLDEGELAGFQIAKRLIKVRRSDLDAYIEARRIKPGDLAHLYPAGASEE